MLFDDNSAVMSDELLSAIERYVRDGGTFVAMHSSGRHALLEADTWPITRLTGFRCWASIPTGTVTVEKHNPLLTKLAGLKFNGGGLALNWIGIDAAKEQPSVALQAAEDAVYAPSPAGKTAPSPWACGGWAKAAWSCSARRSGSASRTWPATATATAAPS